MKDILKNISYNKVTIICIFCYADYTILANRYNDRIFNKKRHISLSINNQYPIINNITKFHEKININNVLQSYNQIEEEVFGNHTLKINTNNIDKDFNIICNNIIEFIKNIKQS
ncbi:hypothetical protein Bint_0345 [Brachyspira intermedia PWS/A]|uniref:Uncharacterized protein n=1 Tax=Brachyspira intermedia (strain ATCC 51140 / PWS/A) TaxID=1045858 RepID=G0EIH1_BRAIP|nr:hypothetical protein [Brachyspira intermedia]AEM20979.1 hypothetical protein Bint_0345 [Brachyspira intermedia PWS/A]